MNLEGVRQVADAMLYEGYLLYPYRPTSIKNRQRWTFGGLYPERYAAHSGNASSFESQFLAQGEGQISVVVRFLHLLRRPDGLEEGIPREVGHGAFHFQALDHQCPVEGIVELAEERISRDLRRITLRVRNLSGSDDSMAILASGHAIALVTDGSFLSLIDPPEEFREEALACRNTGVWPVLAGDPDSRDHLLISPIILYDYPQIAPESPGDLFDSTEIDEILSLRIMTLTDQEKDEIRAGDSRTRRVLERTESLSEQDLMKLHGVLRGPRALEGRLP
jgi:hypothetical protein